MVCGDCSGSSAAVVVIGGWPAVGHVACLSAFTSLVFSAIGFQD